jgi:hypothetical protein
MILPLNLYSSEIANTYPGTTLTLLLLTFIVASPFDLILTLAFQFVSEPVQ